MRRFFITPEIKKLDAANGIEMCTYHVCPREDDDEDAWEFVLCWRFMDAAYGYGQGIPEYVIPSSAPAELWQYHESAELHFRSDANFHMQAIACAIAGSEIGKHYDGAPPIEKAMAESQYYEKDSELNKHETQQIKANTFLIMTRRRKEMGYIPFAGDNDDIVIP